jgi:hypothetical protein
VGGNLEQMSAREPLAVVEVRRHPELTFGQTLIVHLVIWLSSHLVIDWSIDSINDQMTR